MGETKNLIVAIFLSVAVIFTWEIYNAKNAPVKHQEEESNNFEPNQGQEQSWKRNEKAQPVQPTKSIAKDITFENDKISGVINLKALRITELVLKNYDAEKGSEDKVRFLQSKDSKTPYFAESGWQINNIDNSGNKLTSSQDLKLRWVANNGSIEIIRTVSLDDNYMFEINDTVTNHASFDITLNQYALLNSSKDTIEKQFYILHEGPFGMFNDTLYEIKYDKLVKTGKVNHASQNGWAGISDKYWFTAFIPDTKQNFNYRFTSYNKDDLTKFQTDLQSDDIIIPAGLSYSSKNLLFAGAKEIKLIDQYEESHNIHLFDRSIDFGILYFLTKPIYLLLKVFYTFFNNFGVAIIALTIFIRFLMYPLASKSFREISKIKAIQPELMKVREVYGDDKMRIQREVMSLYKAHKIKPMMGCLPVLVQVFIFFSLYKVLFVTIDMRHAPFFGWITDLTQPDPTSLINLFGLLPFDLGIPFGVWPCLLCITMILQQKLNPAPADPMQAKMMKFLPYLFVVLFAGFPAGLVIYWTFNNSFSIVQQYLIMKKTEKAIQKTR